LKGFFEVVIILNVSTGPSAGSDNYGLVGSFEGLEMFNDLFVIFDGIEVFIQNIVEGSVLVL
jgi:hypothetical protein